MSESKSLEDKRLEPHRVAMQEKHTAGLRPGWYVLTGFFWHEACSVIAGPFTTQDDAWQCRTALEVSAGHHQYYIDEADASAPEIEDRSIFAAIRAFQGKP